MTPDPLRKVSLVGAECYRNFLGFNSATQVIRGVKELYGALQAACERGVAKNILLKYEKNSYGVAVW